MNKKVLKTLIVMSSMLLAMSAGSLFAEDGQISASYLYTLSNFAGVYPISWAKLDVDKAKNEVYVVSLTKIKIFNETGMEVYSFNEMGELGWVSDIAVLKTGDILVLAFNPKVGRSEIIRCDFRGEPLSTIELKNLPEDYAGFTPNRIVVQGNSIYLANMSEVQVIETDISGVFRKAYDISPVIQQDIDKEFADNEKQKEKESEKEKQDRGMTGFSVDSEGNIMFTNSALARVYVLASDGIIRSFGQRGSAPGKFGVPGDVVADATGKYLLVADTLRCVVLVFDKNFQFITEFGIRGYKPSNLLGPMYMAVDSRNRVYVSQLRNRGVNVYQIAGS
jgi:DNA-binding beta-propeller fold protein YncE